MKYLILLSTLILSSCVVTSKSNQPVISHSQSSKSVEANNDYELLLASLLNEVNKTQFGYTDQLGITKFDELKHFKTLETIYVKNITKNQETGRLSQQQIKNIMFFAFYASEKNSAAFLEYLAEDLMGIYKLHTRQFIDTLNKLPFLIESNCNRINAFFGFEGKNANLKPQFLDTNRPLLSKALSAEQFNACLNEFK